jgi:hypothetical protein
MGTYPIPPALHHIYIQIIQTDPKRLVTECLASEGVPRFTFPRPHFATA